MTRRAIALVLLLLMGAVTLGAQSASDPWIRRSAKPKDFVPAKLPWNAFSLELPKSWQISPGYAGVLLSAVERTKNMQAGGSIMLEQMKLPVPLKPSDIDEGLADLEVNLTKTRDPGGQGFQQQLKDIAGQRIIFVTYTRPGLNGNDSVVQYVIPSGSVMYRIVCVAPSDQLVAKYQTLFAHVAASFKVNGAATD